MNNCCPFSATLIFFHTMTAPLQHIPLRQTIVSFTQDASAHNSPFDGMHSGYRKKKSFIQGKEPSSANGLNLS